MQASEWGWIYIDASWGEKMVLKAQKLVKGAKAPHGDRTWISCYETPVRL